MARAVCGAGLFIIGMSVCSCRTSTTTSSAPDPAPTPGTGDNVEQTLKQIERDWTDAWMKRDSSVLDRIIADDFSLVSPDGTLTKAGILAELKSDPPIASMILDPMTVRVFGDTAVVTGGDTETEAGKNTSDHFLWLTVFVKRNGRWQAVASQEFLQPAKTQG